MTPSLLLFERPAVLLLQYDVLSGDGVHKAASTLPTCRSITQSVISGKACPFQQTTQELTWPQCLCGHRHVCACTLCRQVYKFVEVSDSVHDLDVSVYDKTVGHQHSAPTPHNSHSPRVKLKITITLQLNQVHLKLQTLRVWLLCILTTCDMWCTGQMAMQNASWKGICAPPKPLQCLVMFCKSFPVVMLASAQRAKRRRLDSL